MPPANSKIDHPLAVVQQPVEGRQQGCASGERLAEKRRIDPPGPSDALNDRLFADIADIEWLDRTLRAMSAGDAKGCQATFLPAAVGLL